MRVSISSARVGAGRETVDSRVDPAVGVVLHKKVGDLVHPHEPLFTMHVNDRSRVDEARAVLEAAVEIGAEAPPSVALVREVLA